MATESEVFDTEKLIIEVERRPGIYDKRIPEYSDRNAKEKLWIEVCEQVVPNWGRMETEERREKGENMFL